MTEGTKAAIFWVVFLVLLLGGLALIVNAISKLSSFDAKDWVACGLVLTPALAVALAWRMRRIVSSGWVRLAAVTWGGWVFWRIREADEGELDGPIVVAFLAILVPAVLALASWWITSGFRGPGTNHIQGS